MSRDLAETATLLSDPGRTSIVMALLGDIALPAGQLAMIASVAPQTASSHLSKLVGGHILTVEQQGRHRYYRLANADVAHAIEALLAITANRNNGSAPASCVPGSSQPTGEMAFARTCYSHLAGRLAVAIAEVFETREYLRPSEPKFCEVTKQGRMWFERLGLGIEESHWQQPHLARRCLDWSERRHHLAGELGTALLTRFRELKWIAPVRGSRVVRVTIKGQQKFEESLGIRVPNGQGS
jgi:DNA-binding transcriptional ArsR family regulator